MRRIRIGIVGLQFGRIIAERLRGDPGRRYFEIAAVCGNTPGKVAALSAELGVKGVTGLDALLGEPDIPVIGLFTGPEGRAELIRRIIRAGKDVITTKPFETDGEAAEAVLEEARLLGRLVYTNSPSPVLPQDLRLIGEWQAQFGLGRLLAARADTWISYREQADGSWYDDPARCPAAPIFRLGVYPLYDLLRLMGRVEKISAVSSRVFTGRPTADQAQIGLRFEGGALANVFASFCLNDGQRVRHSLILNYENGTVYRNMPLPDVARDGAIGNGMTRLSLIVPEGSGSRIAAEASFPGQTGDYEWEAIYRHLTGERRMDCPAGLIVDGIRIMRRMGDAERSGRWETVAGREINTSEV